MDVLDGAQIDRYIDIRQETLPTAVTIGPTAQVTVREGGRTVGSGQITEILDD